jgi:hypothetical protein
MQFDRPKMMIAVLAVVVVMIAGTGLASDKQTTLYEFNGKTNGGNPHSGLIADAAGNLYGTTIDGGISCAIFKTCGVVFELSPSTSGSWTETVLYSFAGGNDGAYPESALVFDANGNLYGTTAAGGGSTACTGGCGTIFELSPNGSGGWTEQVLFVDTNSPSDGQDFAGAPLLLDSEGNLFGVQPYGGENGVGAIFELSPGTSGWTYTTLFSFTSTTGIYPVGGLIRDAAGNFYGATEEGGDVTGTWGCSIEGCGVVYSLTQSDSGWTYGQLFTFHGPGGSQPTSGLVFDAAGNLYGGTIYGGTAKCCGYGVVFQLSPTSQGEWKETILHSFTNGTDGAQVGATLLIDSKGNLYGTSESAAAFRISPAASGGWQFQVLVDMNPVPGSFVEAALVRDSKGNMYGTTAQGGSTLCKDGCGTVYELLPVITAME